MVLETSTTGGRPATDIGGFRMLYVRGPAVYVQGFGLKTVGHVLWRVSSPGRQCRMLATASKAKPQERHNENVSN